MKTKEKAIWVWEGEEGGLGYVFPVQENEEGIESIRISRDEFAESPREFENLAKLACWHRQYNLGDDFESIRSTDPDDFIHSMVLRAVDENKIIRLAKRGNELGEEHPCLKYSKKEKAWNLYVKSFSTYESQYTWDSLKATSQIAEAYVDELNISECVDILNKYGNIVTSYLYLLDHSGLRISVEDFGDPWDSGCVGFAFISKETAVRAFGTDRNWRTRAKRAIDAEVKVYDDYLRGDVYYFETLDENGDPVDSCGGFYGDDIVENGLLDAAGVKIEA